ncbi:MAG: class I SAM-dependent methyltransferase [Anaerolineales bacterium]|jgi:demethylmenaquinone methyltransferase/2-methoxy-6-polyprenyl-1,4-benzoquinol methylase
MPFDHFNLIAGLFERTANFNPPGPLLDMLDLQPDGLLLDAGGGTGRVAQAMREMVREVVVMDLSRGMLHYAARKGLAATCAPAEHLPFASNAFKRIIMVDALHHVINQREVISEFWRVLAPGGRIVIVEPDIQQLTVKLIALGEKLLLMRSHFFSAKKIAALLENPGVQVRCLYNEMNVWVCAERVREM